MGEGLRRLQQAKLSRMPFLAGTHPPDHKRCRWLRLSGAGRGRRRRTMNTPPELAEPALSRKEDIAPKPSRAQGSEGIYIIGA